MFDFSKEISRYFQMDGFNCAETTFKILLDKGYIENGCKENIKLFTGFGGGMTKGKVCGSVVAAVAALGSIYGRTELEQSREPSKAVVNSYLEKFLNEYERLDCEELISDFESKTRGQYDYCENIIETSLQAFVTTVNEAQD